jgi:[ribosomal protein S5]-alanine N-acetyltransferase
MPLLAPPPINTARSTVRLVEAADLPGLLTVNGDDLVTRHLPYASWQSLADGEAWLARMRAPIDAGTALQFVICDTASGQVLGSCLLFRFDEGSARAELGYVLGRAHWGRGLMFEALQALLAQAYGSLGLRRIEAEVNPANTASARLLERLGFTCEGLLRKRWVAKGATYDVNVYGLLRDEWPAVAVAVAAAAARPA